MDWKTQHNFIIQSFLEYLNDSTDRYVLKGGTALKQCYGLERFSEDIDLDGPKSSQILNICRRFSEKHNCICRIAKNTDLVKRCMIDYNGVKPLKIETSARKQHIPEDETLRVYQKIIWKIFLNRLKNLTITTL